MPGILSIASFTVAMAALATLLMLPPGVAVAWLLARRRFPGRVMLDTLVSLPLVLPPVATGLILMRLLGPRGPIGAWLERFGIEVMFTPRAVVVAMAVMGLPLLVRAARAGFEQVDRRYEQIAATLGAGPARVFFTVSLPLARRGVLAGALLGFSRALGEFGATILLAGALPSTRTIAVAIYTYTETGQEAAATAMLAVSATVAFGALLLSNRLTTPLPIAPRRPQPTSLQGDVRTGGAVAKGSRPPGDEHHTSRAHPEQSLERSSRKMSTAITLDFSLRQGTFTLEIHERIVARVVALFGPSGSGKTSILESIAGLRTPKQGVIRIGTRTLFDSSAGADRPAHERRVGYVPQDLALFPHMNVRRNILYGADAGGGPPLDQVVGMLELGPMLDRDVTALSGGERQRVALARALMASPALLLLDEPLAALDRGLRERILPYLERIRDELAIPMLYVSHAEAEVRAMADWVVELDGGRVVRSGA